MRILTKNTIDSVGDQFLCINKLTIHGIGIVVFHFNYQHPWVGYHGQLYVYSEIDKSSIDRYFYVVYNLDRKGIARE